MVPEGAEPGPWYPALTEPLAGPCDCTEHTEDDRRLGVFLVLPELPVLPARALLSVLRRPLLDFAPLLFFLPLLPLPLLPRDLEDLEDFLVLVVPVVPALAWERPAELARDTTDARSLLIKCDMYGETLVPSE